MNSPSHYRKTKERQSSSVDTKRNLEMMKPFFDFIQKIGGPNVIENFIEDLKNNALYDKKLKNRPNAHITKKDLKTMLPILFDKLEPNSKKSRRSLDRIGEPYKNIILTYFAYKYPKDLLDSIDTFPFIYKLKDFSHVKEQWKQRISRIQCISSRNKKTVNSTTDNSPFLQENQTKILENYTDDIIISDGTGPEDDFNSIYIFEDDDFSPNCIFESDYDDSFQFTMDASNDVVKNCFWQAISPL